MKSICEHIRCVNFSINAKVCGGFFCKYHVHIHREYQKYIVNYKKIDLEIELKYRLLSIEMRKTTDHGHLYKVCDLIKKKIFKINLNKHLLKTYKSENLLNEIRKKIKINVKCGFKVSQNNYENDNDKIINEFLFIIDLYNDLDKFIFK